MVTPDAPRAFLEPHLSRDVLLFPTEGSESTCTAALLAQTLGICLPYSFYTLSIILKRNSVCVIERSFSWPWTRSSGQCLARLQCNPFGLWPDWLREELFNDWLWCKQRHHSCGVWAALQDHSEPREEQAIPGIFKLHENLWHHCIVFTELCILVAPWLRVPIACGKERHCDRAEAQHAIGPCSSGWRD